MNLADESEYGTYNITSASTVGSTMYFNVTVINATGTLASGNRCMFSFDVTYGSYTIPILTQLTSGTTLTDGSTYYFGLQRALATTAAVTKVYIPKTGTITACYFTTYASTAGTNESISMYVRLNNTTDTLVETESVAANMRVWNNAALSISVVAGDYIELKMVCPTWATNPVMVSMGGYVFIET